MVSRRRAVVAGVFIAGLLAAAPMTMRPAHATGQTTANRQQTIGYVAPGRSPFETLPLDAQPAPIDGIPTNCPSIDIGLTDIPDGGWTWVDPAQPIQQLSGVVNPTIELDPTKDDPTKLSSFVRYSDLPAGHNSHDENVHVTVDEADRGLLSLINDLGDEHDPIASPSDIAPPSQLEIEWETGLSPLADFHGDGHAGENGGPIFPKWAWPSPGDRVWVMGNHIYDCGHPIEVAGVDRYKSEIHPAIAMAAMRDQVMTLPGTGTTPVPVVATDLYIHGDGGWATSVIHTHEVFDQGTYFTTPIDRDYDFDIHLPVKPDPAAELKWTVSDGPFNDIDVAPVLTPDLSDPAHPKLHVHIPLAGSGVADLDTYSRQIVAGWVGGPQFGVRHLRIKLTRMLLHDDMDVAGADGELSFFWLNVPKSPTEWQRLSDFEIPTFESPGGICADHTNTMEDYDDDQGCGNGILDFSGPTFDLFVVNGDSVSIQAQGYDQDCDDNLFGIHSIAGFGGFVTCFFPPFDGDNDPYKTLKVDLGPPDYGVGQLNVSNPDNQYELRFTVTEVDSTPPTASPTQSPPANAAGWNNSDVTVSWNWTDEAGGSGIDPANCTTSSVSSGEGDPITLNASCSDQEGNTGNASYDVEVDKTAPTVTVTGVTDGGQYIFGAGPAPGCDSTDDLSGIATAAAVSITTPPGGVGLFTATCSGAVDVAGNAAANVSVGYSVVYGFGGFLSPLPKSTLTKSGSNIAVKFRLTDAGGVPIGAGLSAALAAAGKVQVTLAGPPAVSQTVPCSWDALSQFFQCNIKTPKGLLTGFGNPYTITAYEDVGTGFVVAPPVGTAVNPETIYFK